MFRRVKLDKEERKELVKLRKEKIESMEKDIEVMKKMVVRQDKVILKVIEKFDEIVKEKVIDRRVDQEIGKTISNFEDKEKLKNDKMFG